MIVLGQNREDEIDDVVLVFRPPENPAAQIAGLTPFKDLTLRLEELERAESKNFENATFGTDSRLAQQYHTDFVSIFNQATPKAHGLRRSIQRFLRYFSSVPDND